VSSFAFDTVVREHCRDITDSLEIKKAINGGRYMVKELIGVIQLKKYRTLKSRYNGNCTVQCGSCSPKVEECDKLSPPPPPPLKDDASDDHTKRINAFLKDNQLD
jgi:hypothetical protein